MVKLLPASLVIYKIKKEVVPIVSESELELQITNRLIKRNPRNIKFTMNDTGFRHAAVNYLRHQSWNYNRVLHSFKTENDKKDWKIKLMWKISRQYPRLRGECYSQINRLLDE